MPRKHGARLAEHDLLNLCFSFEHWSSTFDLKINKFQYQVISVLQSFPFVPRDRGKELLKSLLGDRIVTLEPG
jgi:hypothetical protein